MHRTKEQGPPGDLRLSASCNFNEDVPRLEGLSVRLPRCDVASRDSRKVPDPSLCEVGSADAQHANVLWRRITLSPFPVQGRFDQVAKEVLRHSPKTSAAFFAITFSSLRASCVSFSNSACSAP